MKQTQPKKEVRYLQVAALAQGQSVFHQIQVPTRRRNYWIAKRSDKEPHDSQIKRGFLCTMKNCSKAELKPIPQGRIADGGDVYTYGCKTYDGFVTNGYRHHRDHQHENEFARGKIMLMSSNHFGVVRSFA